MKRNVFFIVLVTVLILIIASLFTSVGFYVDYLFFKEVGYESVFKKTFSTKILTAVAYTIAGMLLFLVNVLFANRMVFPQARLYAIERNLYGFRKLDLNRIIKTATLYLTIPFGLFFGIAGSRFWEELLLYLNSEISGLKDPIFDIDVSFYIFKLPLLEALLGTFSFCIFIILILILLNYLLRGGVTYIEGLISIDRRVKRHIASLISVLILCIGAKFYLDRYKLLFSDHGILFGASYTDVHARLLMLNIITILSVVTAVGFFIGITRRSVKAALIPLGLLILFYIVGLGVYPSALQGFKVSPNEIVLEKPYIGHHIRFTRFGYDLDKIQIQPFEVSDDLDISDIEENISTIRNIRLWDEKPLLKTYSQLQQIRTYYKFNDVDNDRYMINGKYTQVMLSPRELSYEDLPGKSWINERLVFTHGIGLAMGPVSGITREGLPEFILKDIPPVSPIGSKDVSVKQPEIYYGESPNEYVIVKTKVKEFSYPTKEGNVYTTYTGTGGVQLSSLFKRVLYALHFGNFKIFLSTDITSESRILYYRNILERVDIVAPYLLYDPDPYMVVSDDGRLFWIIDAYTYTNRLPYSAPIQRGINYIRNPVKVVVDAYNGSMNFYVVDDSDIIIKTFMKIFPKLFKPLDEMPEDLRRHIRYPRSLLKIQSRMFATFHMTDPQVFYNKEDLWEIPVYRGSPMEPYYIILRLPRSDDADNFGTEKEEFVLLIPFTPSKRDNLAAWMAARCDGNNYGKIIVYTFPRDRLVFGPRQIDARIDQNAYISQQLTLWGQRGSDVIRGSLLIIPIKNSLIYVQPLYLVATDRVGLPELRRVIVAYGNEVIMEDNLLTALKKMFEGKITARPRLDFRKEKEKPTAGISEKELGLKALESLRKAKQSLRNEDWRGFGEYLKRTEELLKRLAEE